MVSCLYNIECKSPKAPTVWDSASDLKYYQENSEKLISISIKCSIWQVSGKYGVINAPQQFYSVFKTNKED
jgi:type I restriction enzyme R subunit